MPSSLLLAAIISSAALSGAIEPSGQDTGQESHGIVSRHRAVFTAPPKAIPSDTRVDGPLLGNGDMGVCIGGPPERQEFWLSKNDFWRLKSQYGSSSPRVFGRIEVSIPSLEGGSYRVEQVLCDAVTLGEFTKDSLRVEMRSWVAADSNLLVVEIIAVEGKATAQVALHVTESDDSQVERGAEAGMAWGVRRFSEGVDIPTGGACAMKVLGGEPLSVSLRQGKPVILVACMGSLFKSDTYVEDAKRVIVEMDEARVASHRERHAAWWRDFWGRSCVDIGDSEIERLYYLSNYVMGSCSRDPEFPPPIFGTWNTTDTPAWFGDYHLNYNHMAPFYGLYSCGHIEQADTYHAPILDFVERGRWYAREAQGCRGVMYPVGIGPKGIETTRGNTTHDQKDTENGGLFFGQKSNAAYAVVNMSMRWFRTYDPAYAREVYPFVREVAEFWEDYLESEDGRYVIRGDSIHEGSGRDLNPILSLGLVRNVMATALDMADALGVDADKQEKRRHILDNLSGFPTQQRQGKTVFRYTEEGTEWWDNNTLGIQHIYPAGAIGLESPPELLEVARNTMEVMDRWVDFNGMNSFFPAAVRVGYDPDTILTHLRAYATEHVEPNGFAAHNPHGIENCSIVPNTINEMLCMGHQGVLRVFPVWPLGRPARFTNLRAEGAFIVSSALDGGEVQYVRILSERGRRCVMQNPWPNMPVTLTRNGREAEKLTGTRFSFDTVEGEVMVLRPDVAE